MPGKQRRHMAQLVYEVHAGANCSVCQSHTAQLSCVTNSAKEVAYGERVCTVPYVYTPICMQITILACKIRQEPGASQLHTQVCLYRRINQSNNRFTSCSDQNTYAGSAAQKVNVEGFCCHVMRLWRSKI